MLNGFPLFEFVEEFIDDDEEYFDDEYATENAEVYVSFLVTRNCRCLEF